ncbi:hypothetical protein [Criibacterium bergeronii]|uniref:Phage tail protein n=1 Tax=Criibacterium bergeronii TaxID=1871336 RepID=A0A1C0AG38_9FIRM|nr:hypothetical protein [Criibacterium bergeronii]RDY21445.1 hypothetical protein BBG48_004815 [Criibacterium bergeronii]
MSYIAINGYQLPPPKRGVSVVVTTVVNAGRNANGSVVGQRVGRDQYKIDGLEWAWLTADEWEGILSALSDFFVNVTFNDPVSNSSKTLKMYCGDRTGEPYWVDGSGRPTHYRNCKVNLIDTGEGK